MALHAVDLKMLAAGDEQPNPDAEQKRITFSEFYAAYPKKRARKDAMKAFSQVKIRDHGKILPAIAVHKQTDDWIKDGGKYIPLPASWLRGERWDDELDTDLTMGQCSWNVNGNRHGEERCERPGVTEKRGLPYCKTHAERVNG